MCQHWHDDLRLMAYKTPLACKTPLPLWLRRLSSHPPRSSLIDLRCPSFPAKQDRSSFLTCESVIDPEPRLVGVTGGGPWRRGSALMSRTYGPWWALCRKCHPHELGLRLRLFLLLSSQKKFVCDNAAQPVMVILLMNSYFHTEYYHTLLHRDMAHKLVGVSTLSLLRFVALSSLAIWY
jgi:hypothetical protein